MNVAFFGTSDKSIPILEELNKNFTLSFCVTKADKKVGRKQKLVPTMVKTWCLENNIKVIEIEGFSSEKLAEISNEVLKSKTVIGVVADFNYILPNDIFGIFKYGMLNVHFSLLPEFRGASPVQHTILEGKNYAGITFQLIDEGMDTGKIVFQKKFDLSGTETTQSLYEDLFEKASKLVTFVINDYTSKKITPKTQDESKKTYCFSPTHPKSTYIFKEDAQINWNASLESTDRKIRAYFPWPIAWTTLKDMHKNIFIDDNGIVSEKSSNSRLYVSKNPKNLRVKIYNATFLNKNSLKINEIQVEGKQKVSWKDFLNGYELKK